MSKKLKTATEKTRAFRKALQPPGENEIYSISHKKYRTIDTNEIRALTDKLN
jgi:hypothetical protein